MNEIITSQHTEEDFEDVVHDEAGHEGAADDAEGEPDEEGLEDEDFEKGWEEEL